MKRAGAIAACAALVGCRGGDDAPRAVRPAVAPAGPARSAAAAAAPGQPAVDALPSGADEKTWLLDAGAVPAWGAVLERGRMLARRGERGAAWGRIAPERDGDRWLLDERPEAAGLGIRIRPAPGAAASAIAPRLAGLEGTRAALFGAWVVDGDRRWVWQVDRIVTLGGARAGASSIERSGEPGAQAAPLPAVAAAAGEAGAGQTEFWVVATPRRTGDGWEIADRKVGGKPGPTTAILLLPGEAPVYGGQDYLATEERWRLELGHRYAAVLQWPRRVKKGELPVVRALEAPIELRSAAASGTIER